MFVRTTWRAHCALAGRDLVYRRTALIIAEAVADRRSCASGAPRQPASRTSGGWKATSKTMRCGSTPMARRSTTRCWRRSTRPRKSIYFETFIWKGDPLGQLFKDRLAQKAADGVQVCAIFDEFRDLVVAPRWRLPADPGARIPLALACLVCPGPATLRARDHRKLLVVDQQLAFVGGFNIGKLYATQWRDTHLRIRGPSRAKISPPASPISGTTTARGARRSICRWHASGPTGSGSTRNDPARLLFPIRGCTSTRSTGPATIST